MIISYQAVQIVLYKMKHFRFALCKQQQLS